MPVLSSPMDAVIEPAGYLFSFGSRDNLGDQASRQMALGCSGYSLDGAWLRVLRVCVDWLAVCSRLVAHPAIAWLYYSFDFISKQNIEKGRIMETWIPVIVAVLASAPGIFAIVQQRKKEKADASSIQVGVSITLMNEMQEQLKMIKEEHAATKLRLAGLEDEMAEMREWYERKLAAWLRGIRRLVQQIVEAGETPVWLPDELKEAE